MVQKIQKVTYICKSGHQRIKENASAQMTFSLQIENLLQRNTSAQTIKIILLVVQSVCNSS